MHGLRIIPEPFFMVDASLRTLGNTSPGALTNFDGRSLRDIGVLKVAFAGGGSLRPGISDVNQELFAVLSGRPVSKLAMPTSLITLDSIIGPALRSEVDRLARTTDPDAAVDIPIRRLVRAPSPGVTLPPAETCVCNLTITWHTIIGADGKEVEPTEDFQKDLDAATNEFKKVGLCITWKKGITMGRDYRIMSGLRQRDRPREKTLEDFAEDLSTASEGTQGTNSQPAFVFPINIVDNKVRELGSADRGVNMPGMAIELGGNVAAVKRASGSRVIIHELGHIFGLAEKACPFIDATARRTKQDISHAENKRCVDRMLENCEKRTAR